MSNHCECMGHDGKHHNCCHLDEPVWECFAEVRAERDRLRAEVGALEKLRDGLKEANRQLLQDITKLGSLVRSLEGECSDLRAEVERLRESVEDADSARIDAQLERNEYLEALQTHGQHLDGCKFLDAEVQVCDCGLSDSLRGQPQPMLVRYREALERIAVIELNGGDEGPEANTLSWIAAAALRAEEDR